MGEKQPSKRVRVADLFLMDRYCEVKGDKVRACFLDRCWQESQTQCGDWSTSSSSISLWMQVTCEIADHVIPRKALHVVPLCRSCPLTPDHRRRIQLGGLPDFRPHRHHSNVSAAAPFASSFEEAQRKRLHRNGDDSLTENGWAIDGINDCESRIISEIIWVALWSQQ